MWVRLQFNFKSKRCEDSSRVYSGSRETGSNFPGDLGRLFKLSFNSLDYKEGALAFKGLDADLTESMEGLGTQ